MISFGRPLAGLQRRFLRSSPGHRVRLGSARKFSSSFRFASVEETQILHNPPKSFVRRALGFTVIAVVFTFAGFTMSAIPAFQAANGYLNPPSDAATLAMYTPEDDFAREVEEKINNNHIASEMRSKAGFTESRPHLRMPEAQRGHNLTGGTLMGQGKVVVPPIAWNEDGGKSIVSIAYIGSDLCGHPGFIHGGYLATMLDEGLARCCFGALPNKIAMTANLNIDYRAPSPADSFLVLRATTVKVEGRKAWVEGHIETLVGEGEKPVVLVEAKALFIEPRQAATMVKLYPVD